MNDDYWLTESPKTADNVFFKFLSHAMFPIMFIYTQLDEEKWCWDQGVEEMNYCYEMHSYKMKW